MPIDRDKVLQAAQKHVEKKRFDRAIAEYQKIIQEDPNDARILLKIGDLQARMEAYPDAIATYERVARHYTEQGFSVKAIAVYKQIREMIRKYVPTLADQYAHIIPKLAELYQQLGLTGDALATYDEYATSLQNAGREKDAIDVFGKIVELNGNNPLARLRLAEALLRNKDSDGALAQFGRAAEILTEMGRKDDALKVIERVLHHRADPVQARRAAELYLERGMANDGMIALAKLQICFQADQRNLDTLDLLARAFVTIGQASKAVEVRKEAVRIAREQGKLDAAKRIANQLLGAAPSDDAVRVLIRSLVPPSALREPSAPPPESVAPAPISVAPLSIRDDDLVEIPPDGQQPTEGDLDVGLGEEEEEDFEAAQERRIAVKGERLPAQAPEVPVDESIEAAEDLQGPQSVRGIANVGEALSNARAFRDLRLLSKAVETLRIALELNPLSIDLHHALKETLFESGDVAGVVDELVTIAAMHTERENTDAAAIALQEVLALEPYHVRAREVLAELGYELPPLPSADQVSVPESVQGVSHESHPSASPTHDGGHVAYQDQYEQESTGPLPSYDLEEISPAHAMSPIAAQLEQTGSERRSMNLVDDPFGLEGPTAVILDEPFGRDRPLPSFPLIEGDTADLDAATYDAGYSDLHDEPAQADSLEPYVDQRLELYPASQREPHAEPLHEPYAESQAQFQGELEQEPYEEPAQELSPQLPADVELLDETAAAVHVSAVGLPTYQDVESLEEVLDEAEFFATRNLLDDALAIIDEQLIRYPGHPLLLERQREYGEALAVAGGSGELIVPHPHTTSSLPGPVEDRSFDIAASLSAMEIPGFSADEKGGTEAVGISVDVEEIFAKFKEGVRKQVAETDSQSHYDLGLAYKEMGLLKDAISEFEIASRDPDHACVCHSMIGMIHFELGNTDAALEALLRGLHGERRTPDQELSLCYEIGNVYEARQNPREALYYYQKVSRGDPRFRDIAARIATLETATTAAPLKTAVGEEDLDRVFDDFFKST